MTEFKGSNVHFKQPLFMYAKYWNSGRIETAIRR